MFDDLDLLMRIAERKGYGVRYGEFVAHTTERQRHKWLVAERKKQDKIDEQRRKAIEAKRQAKKRS